MTTELSQFNPMDSAVQQCPFPWYSRLRNESPVSHNETTGWWFVTAHDAIVDVLRKPELFSSRVGKYLRPAPPEELADAIARIQSDGWPETPVLVVEDPPIHRRQRVLVQRAFGPRRVASMETAIRRTADTLADQLDPGTTFDFVTDFATPFPLLVLADALQIPRDRLPDFKRWSDNRVRSVGSRLTAEEQLEVAQSEVERQKYFAEAFNERRTNPRDDLMTDLVQARIDGDGDRPLSTEELLSIIGQVLAAGNESTTKTLTEIMHQAIVTKPELWSWLREDPEGRAPAVVDEGLRIACPFQILLRVAMTQTEIGGVAIPENSIVALVLASANRDEKVFDNPEEFVPQSSANDHITFGVGIHRCVGANLARLELIIAVEALAKRFARIEPAPDAAFDYGPSFIIRGMPELRLRAHIH
ncbi:cytochrome P450 [Rhodococcus koreensis]